MRNSSSPIKTLYSYQFGAIMVGVMLGVGPLFLGRIAVTETSRDGWIAMLVACILIILNTLLLLALARRFPVQNVIEYSQVLLGRLGGILFSSIWILLGICICVITLWYAGHIFQTYILFYTPTWITMLLLLLLCIYVAWFDLRVLGRVTVVIFLISFPFKLFFIPPLIEHAQWLRVVPILTSDPSDFLAAVLGLIVTFAGYELLLMFYPQVKDQQHAKKHALLAVFYVALMFVMAVFTQQVVYDESILKKIWAPSINYVSLGDFPVIDRIDLVFILYWFCVLFKTLATYLYATMMGAQTLLKTTKRKPILIVISAVVYGVVQIPFHRLQMEQYYHWVFGAIISMSFVVPILFLTLHFLQRKKERSIARA